MVGQGWETVDGSFSKARIRIGHDCGKRQSDWGMFSPWCASGVHQSRGQGQVICPAPGAVTCHMFTVYPVSRTVLGTEPMYRIRHEVLPSLRQTLLSVKTMGKNIREKSRKHGKEGRKF